MNAYFKKLCSVLVASTLCTTSVFAIVIGPSVTQNVSCAGVSDGALTTSFETIPNSTPVMITITTAGFSETQIASANSAGFGSYQFINLPTGTYTVTVSDSTGTARSAPAPVIVGTVSALAVTSITSTGVTCNGGNDGTITASIAGGSGFYTATVTNIITTLSVIEKGSSITPITFTGLTEGLYQLTAYDNNNTSCSLSGPAVFQPVGTQTAVSLTLFTAMPPTCSGSNNGSILIYILGGTSTYTLTATPQGAPAQAIPITMKGVPSGEVTFPNLFSGTYVLTAFDSNNCPSNQLIVTVPSRPQLFAQPITVTNETCPGAKDGIITINASGGAPYDSNVYVFNVSGQPSVVTSTPYTSIPLAVGPYQVSVTDSVGCSTPPVTVTIEPPTPLSTLTPATQSIAPTCPSGSDGQIIVYATGGQPPLKYAVLTPTPKYQSSNILSGLAGGINYSVSVEDSVGCSIVLSPIFVPTVTFTPQGITVIKPLSCTGASDAVIKANVTGGLAPVQFTLDGVVGPSADPVFTNVGPGFHTITITDANTPPCTLYETVYLPEPAPLAINFIVFTSPTCAGTNTGSLFIVAVGGTTPYSYSVDGGLSYSSSDTIPGLAAGTYSVVVKDANGCLAMSTGIVPVGNPLVFTTITKTNVSAVGEADGSITITVSGGSGGYMYSINGGTSFSSNNTFTGLTAGTYSLAVKDTTGCTITGFATIL